MAWRDMVSPCLIFVSLVMMIIINFSRCGVFFYCAYYLLTCYIQCLRWLQFATQFIVCGRVSFYLWVKIVAQILFVCFLCVGWMSEWIYVLFRLFTWETMVGLRTWEKWNGMMIVFLYLQQRLCNAAKKALAKIPTRNIKLTDKVS